MKTEKLKKGLSLFLVVLMLLSIMPAVGFIPEAEAAYPVMKSFNAASGDDFHRYYKQVYTVTFLDEIDTVARDNALEKWDMSADGDGSVWGWMYLNDEATAAAGDNRYDVYVAAEGGVAAHENTTHMFYVFSSLKEVKGMENFHTGNVKSFLYWFGNCFELENIDLSKLDTSSATTFKQMFYGCYMLREIDASSWDTSNVTSLELMFYRCYALERANLSGWDTGKVTSMKGLFEMTPPSGVSPDYSLKSVDLSGWNTSNVTTMENMFKNCEALTELDLSSFDTSKVTTMRFMFYYCKQLKNIYVGEGWTTEAIANINDGVFNCCYALVGQTDDQVKNEEIYIDKHPSAYYPPSVEYAKFREDDGYLDNIANKPQKPRYTVTYKFIGDIIPEGVTPPDGGTYEEGTTVTVADNSSAEHYIFSGWSTDDATVENGSFVITNDVEFVGSWTKLYQVTYEYDDSYELPADAPEIPDVELWFAPGEDVPVYGVPYAPEYIFVGWNTGDAEVIGDSFLMPENDVVLYGYYKKPVNSIEISGGDLTIDIGGEKVKVEVIVDPPNATFKDVIYESGNENIVQVDENGNLNPVGVGTTTITIISVDDPTKTDTVNVTVKIPVTDISVDRNVIDLDKGDTDKITVTDVKPSEATNKEVTYVSSNPEVVTVDEDGNIVAVGDGTATITVTSKDNKTVKETVTVTVTTPVTDITVPENEITLELGDEQNVGAKVNDDATNKELTYESDAPGVVKVDSEGNIIAVGKGEATITITSKDDSSIIETVKVKVEIPVEKIEVEKEEFTLTEGGTDKITVIVTPDDATNKKVTYESNNPDIVTVDEEGNITAVGEGEAEIIVKTEDGTKTVTVKVTVEKPVIPVEKIEVEKDEFTLTEGDKDKIEVTVTPDDATNKKVTYESSDESIVTVDEEGNITAVGEGEAEIIVKTEDGTKAVTVKVTVEKPEPPVIPVEKIEVEKEEFTLTEGGTDKITVIVTPDDATNKKVTYESKNPDIVTVDEEGNITAVGEGEAEIIVKTEDGTKTVTVKVTVEKPEPPVIPVEKIEVEKEEFTLTEGGTDKITVIVTPDDATNKKVTYESKNPDIVTVDEEGNITAVGEGEAEIIVKTEDGTKTVTVKVTVEKPVIPVEKIEVEKEEFTLTEGDTDKITVIVTPDDATNKKVTYESKNPDIVTVDEEGNITAVGEGEAEIIVKTEDGTKTVTVKVTVKKDEPDTPEEPEYVIEVVESVEVKEGVTELIYVKVTPNDGSLRPTFSSADESIAKVDEFGNVTGVSAGTTTIYVSFPNGEVRAVIVTVPAPIVPGIPSIPKTHHVCFGKTDGIGWYEVSVNGGDFFPQGPNSTLEVQEGSILVVRVQDMWIDDEFDFYVNGSKVPMDPANTITVVVDGYMLIGALSMDVEVPDVDESLTIFQRIIRAIKEFFAWIGSWFK